MPNCKTVFKIPVGKIETKNQMSCRVTSLLWLTTCPPVIVPTRMRPLFVSWKHVNGFVTLECTTNNNFIVCFTTAYPGLKLYHLLHALQYHCLYPDTDSVTFISHLGDWMLLLRDYLGGLTGDLLPDEHILVFVSSGPKFYGYLQSGGKGCLKVKGIDLSATKRKYQL